jgi:hypothetical protein
MRRIGDRAMSGAERQARYRAKQARAARARGQSPACNPAFAGVPGPDEIAALFGLPTVPDDKLAALRALPGGSDPADFDPYEDAD